MDPSVEMNHTPSQNSIFQEKHVKLLILLIEGQYNFWRVISGQAVAFVALNYAWKVNI